jgi:hypothetical protein
LGSNSIERPSRSIIGFQAALRFVQMALWVIHDRIEPRAGRPCLA